MGIENGNGWKWELEMGMEIESTPKPMFIIDNLTYHVGYFMSNDGMVLTPSLVTVSEVFIASILYPPIITRLWSWPTVQTLEPHLSSVRVSGRVDQFSCAALHWVQLLLVSGFPPPQNRLPD